jgi:predicted N-acetyltransferase YhbS
MIIRPIKDTEYQYLYDFTKKAFSTAYVSSGDEQDYASNVRASGRYIKDLEYIVEDGGRIVGDVLFSTFPLPYNQKSILLDVACIDIDFRNKGLKFKIRFWI